MRAVVLEAFGDEREAPQDLRVVSSRHVLVNFWKRAHDQACPHLRSSVFICGFRLFSDWG